MGIMSDEPLLDDASLDAIMEDEFDWSAVPEPHHITCTSKEGRNIMKTYHRTMHTAWLFAAGASFSLGAWFLGRAIRHAPHVDNAIHDPFRDANEWEIMPPVGASRNQWLDAEPEWLSGFDPIHPDYVDHYRSK